MVIQLQGFDVNSGQKRNGANAVSVQGAETQKPPTSCRIQHTIQMRINNTSLSLKSDILQTVHSKGYAKWKVTDLF